MKNSLTILFILVSMSSFSINDSLANHYLGGLTFGYGQKFFHDDFNGSLKSINAIESNSLPIQTISFSLLTDINISPSLKFPSYLRFTYVIPEEVEIDSVSQTLRGFNFNFPLFGHRIVDQKIFGLFISEGIQVGRLKLVDDDNRKMKNMIIAPYVGLVTKFNFSKITITALAQYEFDISSTIWKKQWFHKGQDVQFNGLRQSGLTFSVGIGRTL